MLQQTELILNKEMLQQTVRVDLEQKLTSGSCNKLINTPNKMMKIKMAIYRYFPATFNPSTPTDRFSLIQNNG